MNFNSEGFLTLSKSTELKPYQNRTFKSYKLATDQEIYDNTGGTLIVDTENYLNYFLIAFKSYELQKYFLLEPPFDPRKLSWILQSYRIIGFNSINYDMPLIWLSYRTQDLQILKKASNKLIGGMHPAEFKKEYNIEIFDTNYVDLIEVCPLRGSLKLYGARLHAPRIQDVPFDPYGSLTNEQINVVRDYCINDLDTTELALNNLKEQLQLREQLSKEYKNQTLMSKSDAQIAEVVIGSELKKLTGKWPKRPTINSEYSFKFKIPSNMNFQTDYMKLVLEKISNINFSIGENGRLEKSEMNNIKIRIGDSIYRMGIGGLHSSEECTAWKSNDEYQIYDRDVASFYPEIVRKLKLYPQHLGQDFLKVYDTIVERRLAAKKAKRVAESENLKVTINGTFGKTGSPYSILYAPEMTIQITVGGQLYLLMLIEIMEFCKIKVISANTDGIVMWVHKNQYEKYLEIIKWWEETTGFATEETKYSALYSRDVNAYIAIKPDGEIKGKNILYDPWRGKSAKDKYWRFQKNPNAQICIEALELYITKNISVETTITECKDITKFVCVKNVKGGAHKNHNYLGKVIRWYMAKNIVGTINYILTGNKVPDTDGAKPCMDLPKQFPDDINYKWYIDKTIEMLYEIAFLKKLEQMKFF